MAYYKTKADREYLTAFEDSSLANVQDSSEVVAAHVKASAVRVALIAALDDWAVCAVDKPRLDWLLAIAPKLIAIHWVGATASALRQRGMT